MIHLLQSLANGQTELADVPRPVATGPTLLVETRASVVSAGTERMLVEFGRASLFDKARRQPDKVRQVLDKVRADGVHTTLEAVRAKLDAPVALGYCQAGVVVETGPLVDRFAAGDRVVTNGPHAEYVRVAQTLAARIPAAVDFESAAFAPLGAIALQGLRLAQPTLGETTVVYGLGLIGQLAVQLARAAGCRVIGIERDRSRAALAERLGAAALTIADGDDAAEAVMELTGGEGADVVLLTLATTSDAPLHAAATMARKRGRIVLVGVAGLNVRRDDFYRKELTFQVSCSYGPGRYDPVHEEKGVDYPAAFVRWTEARNFAAVLALMADGRLDVRPLVTHRFAIVDAARAYDVVAGAEPSLGIVLSYAAKAPVTPTDGRTVILRSGPSAAGRGVVGCVGAGNFASRFLIPAFARAGATLELIASSGGVSAAVVGRRAGFRRATTDAASMLREPALDTIVVATRHDSHAEWTARALESGKHVFVEKPLATRVEELDRVRAALTDSGAILCVGFNRRYAPLVRRAASLASARVGPLALTILVSAGRVGRDHWTQDREAGGGRIVGEACHFIDIARFFCRSSITGLQVITARGAGGPVDDVALLQLSFADGSVAAIQYLSNGHRGFPKERLELFFDGKAVRIDNYRALSTWGVADVGGNGWLPRRQDKGHGALAAAFLAAVRGEAPPPIAAEEIIEVSDWSIRAAVLAARGGGSA